MLSSYLIINVLTLDIRVKGNSELDIIIIFDNIACCVKSKCRKRIGKPIVFIRKPYPDKRPVFFFVLDSGLASKQDISKLCPFNPSALILKNIVVIAHRTAIVWRLNTSIESCRLSVRDTAAY